MQTGTNAMKHVWLSLAAAVLGSMTAQGHGPSSGTHAITAPPDDVDVQRGARLGTAKLPVDLLADDARLPAGTYEVRLSAEQAPPDGRQREIDERWVEFVQGSRVVGRALAPVVRAAEVRDVLRGAPPAPGSVRIEKLRADRYYRLWFNHQGDQILLHLAIP